MPDDPGVAVYFQLHDKERVLACDKWDTVADNIAAIAAHIDGIRRQDRYGVGTIDQAFAGYSALPPPGGTSRPTRPWHEVLGVNRFATPEEAEIVDEALGALTGEFEKLYAKDGRPSIPPEKLLRTLLLQAVYSVRSERQLMEQLDYNLLFRWFVGL